MQPTSVKPAVKRSSVFSSGGLSPFKVSTIFPSSNGGVSAIIFNPIIVVIVESNKAACFLQAVLISVCIWHRLLGIKIKLILAFQELAAGQPGIRF